VLCNENVIAQLGVKYPEGFKGLSFVMMRGDGRAGVAFDKMVKDKQIQVHLVNSIKGTLRALLYERYDCTVTSKSPSAWCMKQLRNTRKYRSMEKNIELKQVAVISKSEGYLGYSNSGNKFLYKKDFSIKFDIEIYKMKQSGELDNIVNSFVDLKTIRKLVR